MIIAVDFDGVLVQETSPLVWQRGAKEGLLSLIRAGHKIIIHTARTQDEKLLKEAQDFLKSEGFHDLYFWNSKGKPYADIYLDDRAIQVHGSFGVGWDEISREYGVPIKKGKDWDGDGDPPRLKLIFLGGNVEVWLVDGTYVREAFDIDFTQGGHHYRYKWIPEKEIWIDDSLHTDERPFVILHEAVERKLMKTGGLTYEVAHEIASRIELQFRRKGGQKGALERAKANMEADNGTTRSNS
jgi:hypothetical protein